MSPMAYGRRRRPCGWRDIALGAFDSRSSPILGQSVLLVDCTLRMFDNLAERLLQTVGTTHQRLSLQHTGAATYLQDREKNMDG